MAEEEAAIGSDEPCQKYSVLNNHPSHHKVLSDVLDAPQFCEAFFHVPKVELKNKKVVICEMQCLPVDKCRVNTLATNVDPLISQPKYVVSFVVLKIGNDVIYKALFENCVQEEPTKHAEEFFHEDARTGELKKTLDELKKKDLTQTMANLNLKEKYMYMYITLQPCYFSIENDNREKSCTEILIEFYEENLKRPGIHFIVKPTFIYKAYQSVNDEMTEEEKDEINNAKEGLRKLFKKGIQVQAMEEEDWTFLKDHLCPSIELFPGSTYKDSQRKKLDDFIGEVLEEIGSGSDSPPRGSDPPPSDSDPPPSGSDPPPSDSDPPSRDSDPPSRDSDPPPSDSDPPPSGSDPPPSDSDPPPSDSAQQSSDSDSPPRGTVSRSSDKDSGARPKERKKKDEEGKKKQTKHGKLASNQPNTTTCSWENVCVQREGEKKRVALVKP